jgi:hypothetical protein
MNQGKLVFAQIMEHLPLSTIRRCVARYDGEHKGQPLLLARSISVYGIRTTHMEREFARYRSLPASNTLANANAVRDWRIYCDFAQRLIGIARGSSMPRNRSE